MLQPSQLLNQSIMPPFTRMSDDAPASTKACLETATDSSKKIAAEEEISCTNGQTWIARSLQLKNQKKKEKSENAKAGGSGRGGEEQGNEENEYGAGGAGNDGQEQGEAAGTGGKKKNKRGGKRGMKESG
ncbi:hypothetical protein JOM56_000625 [Amanita muscaria]